jgi:hypothetical protein
MHDVDFDNIEQAIAAKRCVSFIRLETGQTVVIATGDLAEAITGPIATMAIKLESSGILNRTKDDPNFLMFEPFSVQLIKP